MDPITQSERTTIEDAISDHRRLVAEYERTYQAWAATRPGTADASVAYDAMRQLGLRLDAHEEQMLTLIESTAAVAMVRATAAAR